ncbi:HET-domain-containing protein [Hypoxylon crocopeplum]|nr:HET-domain-containing protein [Hypoxylon crocopeplum]
MDLLIKRLGNWPYQLEQFSSLRSEALSLLADIKSGVPSNTTSTEETIEMLEAMASLIDFNVFETFPEFYTKLDADAVRRKGPQNSYYVPPITEALFSSFADTIMELKEAFFSALHRPTTCASDKDYARICQYCNWVLSRTGRGLHEAHDTTKHEYYQLCAVDQLPEFPVLQERSQYGCDMCNFLLTVVRSMNLVGISANTRLRLWVRFHWGPRTLEGSSQHSNALRALSLSLQARPGRYCLNTAEFFVETDDEAVAPELGLNTPPREDLLTPDTVKFIQEQLNASIQGQQNGMEKAKYIPRRLIDLGPSSNCSPRLIDRIFQKIYENEQSNCKYATLSYCWGPREDARAQLKLTAETWEMYARAIPLDIMTPVIRDTVTVCRALHIRYVWIDALCIMQDSLSDWEEQSYQMSEIFGSSWLTICTIKASSCLEGFLKGTNDYESSPNLPYALTTTASVKGSYRLRRIRMPPGVPGGVPFAMLSPLSRDLIVSKWNERGWIFQEKYLSPRKAYFGSTMVHFQYKNAVRSQSGYVHDERSVSAVEFLSRFPFDLSVETITSQGRHTTDYWYKIIEYFAGLSWTERSDLFPGLSGIARRFGDVTGDQYVAGLWKNDLHCGLLWRTANRSRRTKKAIGPTDLQQVLRSSSKLELQLAPSWSWASRENFEQFLCTDRINTLCRVRTHLRAEFKIVESRVRVEGVNPLGRLKSASLLVAGRMLSLPAGSMPEADKLGKQSWRCRIQGGVIEIFPDWVPESTWDTTGISTAEQSRLRFLLVSSCCSEWQPPSVDAELDIERKDYGVSNREPVVWGPDEYAREKLASERFLKPEYRNTFSRDGGPEFNATTDCSFCSDEKAGRDIWGLLVYPANIPNAYYRVGIWLSRAEYKGFALFRHAPMQTLELL